MKKNNLKHSNHNFNRSFQFPEEIVNGSFILTLMGDKRLLVENYVSLNECKENSVEILCKNKKVHILGSNLNIRYFYQMDCVVEGNITGIELTEWKVKEL